MKEIPLTKGYVALVDDEDYEWLMQWKWFSMVQKSGHVSAARNAKTVGGKRGTIRMHRVIIAAEPIMQVDHINGNPLDNRRCNLRQCSHTQNVRNRRVRVDNSSDYCGVTVHKLGFRARVAVNGKDIHIGVYPKKTEAAYARDRAAMIHHGEFARLNFPEKKLVYAVENLIGFEPGKK